MRLVDQVVRFQHRRPTDDFDPLNEKKSTKPVGVNSSRSNIASCLTSNYTSYIGSQLLLACTSFNILIGLGPEKPFTYIHVISII